MFVVFVFFFKQKTAYEMRISDWSSDVCSSDLSQIPNPQSLIPARVQPLHRLAEVAGHRQRQHVDGVVDRPCDLDVVTGRGAAEYPRGDAVLVPRMADADAQEVELAVAEQAHGVAQAVLATVAAVDLQPRHARAEEHTSDPP